MGRRWQQRPRSRVSGRPGRQSDLTVCICYVGPSLIEDSGSASPPRTTIPGLRLLQKQIERLDAELARSRDLLRTTSATRRSNAAELARLQRELRSLKGRRSVRYALAASEAARRTLALVRRIAGGVRRRVRKVPAWFALPDPTAEICAPSAAVRDGADRRTPRRSRSAGVSIGVRLSRHRDPQPRWPGPSRAPSRQPSPRRPIAMSR